MSATPTARLTGHRIKAGTTNVAGLTTSYLLSALPIQNDQPSDIPWEIEGSPKAVPQYARVVTNADLSVSADGYCFLEWTFSYMSMLMVSYFLSQFLSGGVQSANVTILTYNEYDNPTYLNAILNRPLFQEATWAVGGYAKLTWKFTGGVIIT